MGSHNGTPMPGDVHMPYLPEIYIKKTTDSSGDTTYTFHAPEHQKREFRDGLDAELYAMLYFCVDGFDESGSGPNELPTEIARAGIPYQAIYTLVTQEDSDFDSVIKEFDTDRETVIEWREKIDSEGHQAYVAQLEDLN
jgi:hypothetical protein